MIRVAPASLLLPPPLSIPVCAPHPTDMRSTRCFFSATDPYRGSEATIAELTPGHLVMNMRGNGFTWSEHYRASAWSTDDGTTFGAPVRCPLREPDKGGCSAGLVALPESGAPTRLFLSEPAGGPGGGHENRSSLMLHCSLDGGVSFPHALQVSEQRAGYSSMRVVNTTEGQRILIVWEVEPTQQAELIETSWCSDAAATTVARSASTGGTVVARQRDDAPTYLMPRRPYRMWAFGYNATAGGPTCVEDKHHRVNCTASRRATAVPVDQLYSARSYNLLNPGTCYPKSNASEQSTVLLSQWLAGRGVACMAWKHCWKFNPNTTNDSAVIASFRDVITTSAQRGATAIGLDECGDLAGPKWGHRPGDIPGERKMALAAQGFRQGKKLQPELFVAAWNPGSSAEPDGIFSGLMKDGTFDLAMFETYTHYPGELVHPGGEFQVRLRLTNRS